MSLMWKLSSILIAASISLLGATAEEDAVGYFKSQIKRNPAIKIIDIRVADKMPVPGFKGWSAYVVSFELNVTNRPKIGIYKGEDILFVSKTAMAPELIDRKNGKKAKELLRPKMPKDIYAKTHLLAGNPNAEHKLVLFSDPLCPFCRTYVPKVIKTVKAHPDKMALYYYHLPLTVIHPASDTLVKIMHLMQEDGREDLVEKMYTLQIDPRETDSLKISQAVREQFGYNVAPKRLNAAETAAAINRDKEMSRKLLVSGTPTIFVDGIKDVTREKYAELARAK